jgi:hypothetical protein
MRKKLSTLLLSASILAGLAGCGERPQRTVSEGSYNLAPGNPLAERTLNQGESQRIGD